MSAAKTSKMSSKAPVVDYRVKEGGPFSGTWKLFAGVGALGLLGAAAGYAVDAHRFAYSWLFAFFCFLTPALGALFFVLIQHMTKAGWSVSVRRTAEHYMVGLPVFAVFVLPIILCMGTLYPWITDANAPHGAEHGAQPHGALSLVEGTAHAQQVNTPPETEGAAKKGATHDSDDAPTTAGAHGEPLHRVAPSAGASGDAELEHAEHAMHQRVLEGKRPYLNRGFFYLRAVFYFLFWIVASRALFKLSVDQDTSKNLGHTKRAQALAPVAMILFGVTLTFAAIDWIMSLDPMWYSTMWGVQIFAGSVVSSYALLILTTLALHDSGLVGDAINVEHFHDLGKLQFGFNVFWAYVTFSQFFLIWYSNIPEETTFYNRRWHEMGSSWQVVSWALFLLHFVVPFAILLSRNVKRRFPGGLKAGVIILLVLHWVEMFWIVMPTTGPLMVHWIDIACFLGIGGAYLAVVFKSLAAHRLIPVGDPRLPRALHFENA